MLFGYAIELTLGLRVSPEPEPEGLDIGEHGSPAHTDFVTHGSSLTGVRVPVESSQRSAAHVPVRVEP